MSVTLTAEEQQASPPLLVSRQPVLDASDRVVGYRISYSLVSARRARDADAAGDH